MAQGFIVNEDQVVGITSAGYTAIKLIADESADANSKAIPQGGYLSHLEINADQTAGTTTEMQAYLAWNSAGTQLFLGPSAMSEVVTVGARVSTSIRADARYMGPEPQTELKVIYLFLKTDAGTVTVEPGNVRLQWADGPRQ